MPYLEIVLSVFILLLGIRTLCWHLQCWQIREYRFDRLRAWLRTDDGKKQYFTPWFSQGLLPRPKFSFRILIILFLALLLSTFLLLLSLAAFNSLQSNCITQCFPDLVGKYPINDCVESCREKWFSHFWFIWILPLLIVERLTWLSVSLAVFFSSIPVRLKKLHLFHQAGQVIKNGDQNIIRIGITGSYGKSSTKELLVHLLKSEFGSNNVIYNPANNNTEVAIARLILSHQNFFKPSGNQKFLVIETGAYKKGEIGTVAKMIQPQYSVLTGLNEQHVELFGSIQNTREAKFELAEGTTKTVFFNGDNGYLQEIFADRNIKATSVPISFKAAEAVESLPDKSTFKAYGEKFTLPWPGSFFIHNALLALELCREIGVAPAHLAKHLASLKPLERAMTLQVHPQGFTVLKDTYSANPDGVMRAIEHLNNFAGKKIFVSIPLRELGGHAETVHQQIFEKLKTVNAEVYWEKTDFSDLGKKVLGDKFNLLDNDLGAFRKKVSQLKKDDVVLLESKLSSKVMKLFT